ncbi:hypothetical protein RGC78_11300 [Clostridium sp. 5N-1]|uniref:Uncharacterized protein n=1 Tax=Clostridium aquiflavi TaxID=3073603 RepID=A0ABU1EI17_9CLOT|nr:hypothetical protein [Clostridium sp. 5N-1]
MTGCSSIGIAAFHEKINAMNLLGILLVMASIGLMNLKLAAIKDNKCL